MASFSQERLPNFWKPPFVNVLAELPVESAVELWVKYSLTPYCLYATVDREEEYETRKKASVLSLQRRTHAWK